MLEIRLDRWPNDTAGADGGGDITNNQRRALECIVCGIRIHEATGASGRIVLLARYRDLAIRPVIDRHTLNRKGFNSVVDDLNRTLGWTGETPLSMGILRKYVKVSESVTEI